MAIHAGGKAELVFLRLACGFYGGQGVRFTNGTVGWTAKI